MRRKRYTRRSRRVTGRSTRTTRSYKKNGYRIKKYGASRGGIRL